MQKTWVQSLDRGDSPEKAMATHSSTLVWKIPWTEEPGRLQFMGSLRVRHDRATSFSLFTFMHWRRKWQPTPVFLPRESQGRGARWAAVYGIAQSRTRLKRLSSSSSSSREVGMEKGMVCLPGETHGQRSLVGYKSTGSQRVLRDGSNLACTHAGR